MPAARAAQPGFRVLPYLARPAGDSMTINWISEVGTAGTLAITPQATDGKKPQGDKASRRPSVLRAPLVASVRR